MASKKKSINIKKKLSFRDENEERSPKRVKVEKVKYRNINTWLNMDLD